MNSPYRLTIECEPGELRFSVPNPIAEKGKSPVVVAAAHANAIAGSIERNEWGEHVFERLRLDTLPAGRLQQSVSVSYQFRVRRQLYKVHALFLFQCRDKNALSVTQRALDKWPGIHFVFCWQIQTNALSPAPGDQGKSMFTDL